jgi:hypothetical protein
MKHPGEIISPNGDHAMTTRYAYLLYSTLADILTLVPAPRRKDDIYGIDQPGVYEVRGPVAVWIGIVVLFMAREPTLSCS